MKIIEVRDGFIKFEADENIYLSSFIEVEGLEKSYIAQVNQIKSFGQIIIASAKILFLYNNNMLHNYDKTEPTKDASIKPFTLEILNNSINAKLPVIIGKTLDNTGNITVDSSVFNKKLLVSVDNKTTQNILIRNLTKQFRHIKQRIIVIDTLGIINTRKYIAGRDFKLPLNSSILSFVYQTCLNDVTADSKATIVEIFKDLAEYTKTVPFVPFGTLKNIVDNMVDKQHIFKLLVLKNKLAKYNKLNYFATTKKEVENLKHIFTQKLAIIDLSHLDPIFQNCYLDYMYNELENVKKAQVFLEVANTVSKKNLKNILTRSNVSTTLMTHSNFQYLNDIKQMFDNFIIDSSKNNNEIFKVYSTFLTSMDKDMYLTAGEGINYIPVVSKAQFINDFAEYIRIEQDKTDVLSKANSNIDIDTSVQDKSESEELCVQKEDSSIQEQSEVQSETDDVEKLPNTLDDFSTEELTENSSDNEEVVEEIPLDNKDEQDENEQDENIHQSPTEEEIIAVIDEKSDKAINAVAESIDATKKMDLFDTSDTEEQNEIATEINNEIESETEDIEEIIEQGTIVEELLTEDTESELPDNEEIISQEDIEAELESENDKESEEETLIEEDFANGLADLSTDGNELSEIPNEDILTEQTDIENDIVDDGIELIEEDYPAETELLEEPEAHIEELENSESTLEELQENEQNNTLEENADEQSVEIELDNGTELLLEENDVLPEELPDSSELDVDLSETQVMPLTGEASSHDFDEIVELDPQEADENDIIVDLSEEGEESINIDEEVDQQIIEDVDKVYTTMKNEDSLEEISDSDLDLIDSLNSDEDELQEYEELSEMADETDDNGILEEIHQESEPIREHNDGGEILEKKEANTPIVPVYDAEIPQEDMVVSDPIQQGDAVTHAKYGNGVVEKMIKYGNKTLFAINFENIGRRLLDPTLTEIKRV